MKNWIKPAGLYALVCAAALLSAMALSRVGSAVAVFSRETGTTVVVDAGHGGEDGGTLSCTGVRESGLNLEIALRVNDLFALLGQRTRMLRTQDVSLHDTDAATIAARKASDIRARVRLTEETPKAVLLSIHQNHFPESKSILVPVRKPPVRSENTAARRCSMPPQTAAVRLRSGCRPHLERSSIRTITGPAKKRGRSTF